jgi:hypothetical protein
MDSGKRVMTDRGLGKSTWYVSYKGAFARIYGSGKGFMI